LSLCFVPAMFAAVNCNTNLDPTGTLGADVGAGNLTGCLTTTTGLTAGGATWSGASIAWKIMDMGSYFNYEYSFRSTATSAIEVSHIIIGLSKNCTTIGTTSAGDPCIWNVAGSPSGTTATGPGNQTQGAGNPNLPGDFWGIKFDRQEVAGVNDNPWTVSFNSNRVPVWQNFYAKGGGNPSNYAYNNGSWVSGSSSPFYYIAAPDTQVVPEPGFYGLLSLGVAGLWAAYRRRNQAV
jgi:hypothetical protein